MTEADLGGYLGEYAAKLDVIEAGLLRPPAKLLMTLARALHCKLSDFFVEEADAAFDLQSASAYLGVSPNSPRHRGAGL
jgi:hypothetical protein